MESLDLGPPSRVIGGGGKKPSVETEGLNDCLPYKKNVDEFPKGLSSWFLKMLQTKRCYLFITS